MNNPQQRRPITPFYAPATALIFARYMAVETKSYWGLPGPVLIGSSSFNAGC
jgi:hypothetical protein